MTDNVVIPAFLDYCLGYREKYSSLSICATVKNGEAVDLITS